MPANTFDKIAGFIATGGTSAQARRPDVSISRRCAGSYSQRPSSSLRCDRTPVRPGTAVRLATLAPQGKDLEMRESGKAQIWAARGERLSAALRENLKRRKAQARARAAGAAPDSDAAAATPEPESKAPDFRRNPSRD